MPLMKHVDGVDVEMTPEEEAEFLASLPVFVEPVPASVSDRQFSQALAERELISWDEAEAWGARGEIPSGLLAIVEAMPDEIDRRRTRMFLSSATAFERAHPTTVALGRAMGMTDAALDDLWRFASTL